jgi:hypothetical protein
MVSPFPIQKLQPQNPLTACGHNFIAISIACLSDPIGFDGSRWNLYEYVKGSTCQYKDTTGLKIGGPPPPPLPPASGGMTCSAARDAWQNCFRRKCKNVFAQPRRVMTTEPTIVVPAVDDCQRPLPLCWVSLSLKEEVTIDFMSGAGQ